MKEVDEAKEYEYRIVKLKNGLGKTRYRSEFREVVKLSFIDKFIFGLRQPDWKIIPKMYYPEIKEESDEEKLDMAKDDIILHKASNIWIESIIENE